MMKTIFSDLPPVVSIHVNVRLFGQVFCLHPNSLEVTDPVALTVLHKYIKDSSATSLSRNSVPDNPEEHTVSSFHRDFFSGRSTENCWKPILCNYPEYQGLERDPFIFYIHQCFEHHKIFHSPPPVRRCLWKNTNLCFWINKSCIQISHLFSQIT